MAGERYWLKASVRPGYSGLSTKGYREPTGYLIPLLLVLDRTKWLESSLLFVNYLLVYVSANYYCIRVDNEVRRVGS